jgi:hypothetical protein
MRTTEYINYPSYPSEMVMEQAWWPKFSAQARKQLFEIALDEATKRRRK